MDCDSVSFTNDIYTSGDSRLTLRPLSPSIEIEMYMIRKILGLFQTRRNISDAAAVEYLKRIFLLDILNMNCFLRLIHLGKRIQFFKYGINFVWR